MPKYRLNARYTAIARFSYYLSREQIEELRYCRGSTYRCSDTHSTRTYLPSHSQSAYAYIQSQETGMLEDD